MGWEAGDPPTYVRHPRLRVTQNKAETALILMSGLMMGIGLWGMWYTIWEESKSHRAELHQDEMRLSSFAFWFANLPTLIAIPLTAKNWYSLVSMLLKSAKLMHHNYKQLLLIRALVRHQTFGSWSQKARDRLLHLLQEAQPPAERRSTDTLQVLLDRMQQDESLSIDLYDPRDIIDWWSLRSYSQIDFCDESAIMDYCAAITLFLLSLCLTLGIMNMTAHKDEIVKLCEAKTVFQFFGLAAPLSGQLVIWVCTVTLSIIFVRIVQEAVIINDLLDDDANILLTAATDVQMRSCKDSNEDEDLDQWAKTSSVVTLLHTLVDSIKEVDDRQMLLGFPITAQLRNLIFGILLAALLYFGWRQLEPVMSDAEVTHIADFVAWLVAQ